MNSNETGNETSERSYIVADDRAADTYFRWAVGGILIFVGSLVSVLWLSITGDIKDIKADIKAQTALIADMKADIKLHSSQITELATQIGQLQGVTQKRR